MLYILPTNTCFWIACPVKDIESYKKIYEIKNRPLEKAIAIMVDDFEYLKNNTLLTEKQIDSLINYKNPFTILVNRQKILDKNLLEIIDNLPNSEIYEKIAFRVAHTFMHKKLIRLNWPLFLTSANKSWNPEIFDTIWVKKEFEKELSTEGFSPLNIKIFAHSDYCINSSKKYSDIFEFVGEREEVNYLRK